MPAGAEACGWEVRSEAGGGEKSLGKERAPEQILYLLVSMAASGFCLESRSPVLILLEWTLQSACW